MYDLISSLKIYQPTLHFTPWPCILVKVTIYRRLLIGRDGHPRIRPLFTGPVGSCVISTPWRADSPAVISTHRAYCAHPCLTRYSFTPELSEACKGKVACPRTIILIFMGEKHYISLKILHQAQQATTLAMRHALTI